MARSTIPGYCYLTNTLVAWTAAQWRQQYPPHKYTRSTSGAKGETWYRSRVNPVGALVAEAYAIIPAGRVV